MKTFRTSGVARINHIIGRINRRPIVDPAQASILDARRDKLSELAQATFASLQSDKQARADRLRAMELREQSRLWARANSRPDRIDLRDKARDYSNGIGERYYSEDSSPITTDRDVKRFNLASAYLSYKMEKISARA
jgi:hypothetical protein